MQASGKFDVHHIDWSTIDLHVMSERIVDGHHSEGRRPLLQLNHRTGAMEMPKTPGKPKQARAWPPVGRYVTEIYHAMKQNEDLRSAGFDVLGDETNRRIYIHRVQGNLVGPPVVDILFQSDHLTVMVNSKKHRHAVYVTQDGRLGSSGIPGVRWPIGNGQKPSEVAQKVLQRVGLCGLWMIEGDAGTQDKCYSCSNQLGCLAER